MYYACYITFFLKLMVAGAAGAVGAHVQLRVVVAPTTEVGHVTAHRHIMAARTVAVLHLIVKAVIQILVQVSYITNIYIK